MLVRMRTLIVQKQFREVQKLALYEAGSVRTSMKIQQVEVQMTSHVSGMLVKVAD